MGRTELFLGNLGRDISRSDIEKTFDKYGRLIRCDLKNRGKKRVGASASAQKTLFLSFTFSNRYFSDRLWRQLCFPGVRR